jgi:VanZ family protein
MHSARRRPQAARSIGQWALVVAWMGVIFYFSSRPGYSLPDYGAWDWIAKKGAHIAEYAILGWLMQWARGHKRAWWQSWLMAVAYAATDEFHQSFVPGRKPAVADVTIDAVGAAIGMAVAAWRAIKPLAI